jgi:squalene cyclase
MLSQVDETIAAEGRYIRHERGAWSVLEGACELELTAHALRALLHLGLRPREADEFVALAAIQQTDGGWSSRIEAGPSVVWASAFAALMVARANRVVHDGRLARAFERSVRYFVTSQGPDGAWHDPPTWTTLDATSHPLSFLHVALAQDEGCRAGAARAAADRALAFVLARQSADGAWREPEFRSPSPVVASGSPVEMTAHLLEDSIAGALCGAASPAVRLAAEGAARWLCDEQASDGSWDAENVDHTMDAARALMLAGKLCPELPVPGAVERAMRWILRIKNPIGWGDFPGQDTNLERTCDGVDTLIKYRAYLERDPCATIRLWGYLTP